MYVLSIKKHLKILTSDGMTGKYCSKFLSKIYGVTLPSIIAYIGILRPENNFVWNESHNYNNIFYVLK